MIIKKIILIINWKKKIIPSIIQNYFNNNVLMLAWINKWSLLELFFLKKTCFWSRNKKKYWRKGFFSGNIQISIKIIFDCDFDSLIIKIIQYKNSCHLKKKYCFHNILKN